MPAIMIIQPRRNNKTLRSLHKFRVDKPEQTIFYGIDVRGTGAADPLEDLISLDGFDHHACAGLSHGGQPEVDVLHGLYACSTDLMAKWGSPR